MRNHFQLFQEKLTLIKVSPLIDFEYFDMKRPFDGVHRNKEHQFLHLRPNIILNPLLFILQALKKKGC